uniref:Uncharacterized protein n=1 Tax=Romanomermis culicivorax TaxID=13658 RepID=A0A915JB29_ROMCU
MYDNSRIQNKNVSENTGTFAKTQLIAGFGQIDGFVTCSTGNMADLSLSLGGMGIHPSTAFNNLTIES